MKIYFPQRMEMHHALKRPSPIVFAFENEFEYTKALEDGWVFNPAELKKKEEVVEKEVVEVKPEKKKSWKRSK